jgi:hypothetical protein
VDSQERSSLSDIAVLHGCSQLELSPGGKFLACFGADRDLGLFDVTNGLEIFHKDSFFDPSSNGMTFTVYLNTLLRLLRGEGIVTLRFSPDSRYFAAVAPGTDPLVLELPDAHKLGVPSAVRTPLHSNFTFLAPDQLVGLNVDNPQKSSVVHFPNGGLLQQIPLGGGSLTAATNPRYLIIRSIKQHPVGVLDLQQ